MQCEKGIGPVDGPDVTAFSQQRDDVSGMIDFQQKRIVAAILAAFTPIHCTERNPLPNLHVSYLSSGGTSVPGTLVQSL